MLHTIHDRIYDLNKEARGGIDVDDRMKRLYQENEKDILLINTLMLNYVEQHATKEASVQSYTLRRHYIETLNIIDSIWNSYENMDLEQQAKTARLMMADILEYYERLHLYGHFDEEKFEIQFDLPY